ncbi:NUDIX domain-containing protein [soil metagenome]
MVSKAVFRIASRALLHPWFRLSRGMTLGVRAAIIDAEDRVLLVRHTYGPGWLLPGGGVERGETALEAVLREVREESGIVAQSAPVLHGIFSNEENFRGDHVAVFLIRRFTREPWVPSREIAAAEFFPADALPAGTTGGTQRRIAELLHGTAIEGRW